MCSHKSGNFSDTLHMINRSNIFVGRKENIKTVKMIATMNNIGTMFGYLYRKIARPVATHCKKTWDDMIKIAPTVEIYNRSMVQKHPVLVYTQRRVAADRFHPKR